MQIKAIFLLFVFFTVVVFAQEKNSKEEEDNKETENDERAPQVSSKVPEHPEKPQYPDDSRLFNPYTILMFFQNFKRELEKLTARTDKLLQNREKKIHQKEEKVKKELEKNFSELALDLANQQATELFIGVPREKKQKAQECLNEKLDFNGQMGGDYESALQCVKNSADNARLILKKSRESLSKTNSSNSTEVEHWVKLVKSCTDNGNGYCIQAGITIFRKNINKLRDERNSHAEKFDTTTENLRDQMNNCSLEFVQKLKKGRQEYISRMRECFNV